MEIRKYQNKDANEVICLIHETLKKINSKDYDEQEITRLCKIHNLEWIKNESKSVHFYVAIDHKITGIIGLDKINEKQVKLQTFFVAYDKQNKGIATKLLEVIKQDEYYQNSNEIILSASISAYPFYIHKGFIKCSELNEYGLYEMKKSL